MRSIVVTEQFPRRLGPRDGRSAHRRHRQGRLLPRGVPGWHLPRV